MMKKTHAVAELRRLADLLEALDLSPFEEEGPYKGALASASVSYDIGAPDEHWSKVGLGYCPQVHVSTATFLAVVGEAVEVKAYGFDYRARTCYLRAIVDGTIWSCSADVDVVGLGHMMPTAEAGLVVKVEVPRG
jgi:hypothetical protein